MTDNASNEMIRCEIDGGLCHSIRIYLRDNHPEWTVERYQAEYPNAPMMSDKAKRLAKAQIEKKNAQRSATALQTELGRPFAFEQAYMHELFELGNVAAAKSSTGNPIAVNVLTEHHPEADPYVREIDPDYVFNIDLIKKVLMGIELRMNVLLWGLHGTGKTTVLQQCCARLKRPFMRVQHTGNTEEAHITGQYIVKTDDKGASYTEFQLGPLALAMKYGMVYCADEYDFAMPSVIALYQPVLEGEPLVIKEAPMDMRVIRPHPDFRFVATGNTNGSGDETGLYQGTLIQNAASYSRFHITEEVKYMPAAQEEAVLRSKTGISKADATNFVRVATKIREQFADGVLAMTISPRELITAAKLSIILGNSPSAGIKLAFTNRCGKADQKAVEEVVQRIFG